MHCVFPGGQKTFWTFWIDMQGARASPKWGKSARTTRRWWETSLEERQWCSGGSTCHHLLEHLCNYHVPISRTAWILCGSWAFTDSVGILESNRRSTLLEWSTPLILEFSGLRFYFRFLSVVDGHKFVVFDHMKWKTRLRTVTIACWFLFYYHYYCVFSAVTM